MKESHSTSKNEVPQGIFTIDYEAILKYPPEDRASVAAFLTEGIQEVAEAFGGDDFLSEILPITEPGTFASALEGLRLLNERFPGTAEKAFDRAEALQLNAHERERRQLDNALRTSFGTRVVASVRFINPFGSTNRLP